MDPKELKLGMDITVDMTLDHLFKLEKGRT